MRFIIISTMMTLLLSPAQPTWGQGLYPVKQGGRWGVADRSGRIVVPVRYDAIGHFKHQGFAVVQKDGKAGLLDRRGQFVFQPIHEDIRVISKDLFGISEDGEWRVVDKDKRTILEGYDKVELLGDQYIKFWRGSYCGLIDRTGITIIPAQFQHIRWDKGNRHFIVQKDKRIGLFRADGSPVAETLYKDFHFAHPNVILVKRKYKWGGVSDDGSDLFPDEFSDYKVAGAGYLLLYKQERCYLYSLERLCFIGEGSHENYIPLSKEWIVFQKHKKLGLMDANGRISIPPKYQEILPFGMANFRVRHDGKWGLSDAGGQPLAPMIYDYISPLNGSVAIVRKGRKSGVLDADGRLEANTIYDSVTIKGNRIIAFNGEQRQVFGIGEHGLVEEHAARHFGSISIKKRKRKEQGEDYQLEEFEWFYDAERHKWGLRRNTDGRLRLPPQYDFIEIKWEHQLSIAGVRKVVTQNFGDFPVRFQSHFHLVDNRTGTPTSEQRFREVRFSDFDEGLPSARGVLDNGRHALVDKKGAIVCQGYAYISHFNEGVAAMAMRGQLSSKARAGDAVIGPIEEYLTGTYGPYLIGDFGHVPSYFPQLICHDCDWGYIDTLGRMVIPPDYQAAKDFKDGAGIVRHSGRWGVVSRDGRELIACEYAKISRMEDSRLLHLEAYCEKYGLVDDDGNLICHSRFEEIRRAKGGRMAFLQDGKWGYMNVAGKVVIPAIYHKVQDFSEGMAAVFNGKKWGFIDTYGRLVMDYQYPRVGGFSNGVAWVKTSKGRGYVDKGGRFVIPPIFRKSYDFDGEVARVAEKQKVRLINIKGEYISSQSFDDLSSFDEYGLAVARGGDRKGIHYYLVDKRGERVSGGNYRRIFPFSEGLAAVRKKHKYGFIDTTGKLVVAAGFDKVSQFSEGLAWVKVDGKCGYIDREGEFVVAPEFSKCLDFEGGVAVVHVNARKGGLVDKEGDYILEPKLNRLLAFSEGKGLAKSHQRFYFIRESGDIYEGYYDAATHFENGTAFVEIDGAWGIINQKGVNIVSPKYQSIERMGNGLLKVKVKHLHGVALSDGTRLLPNQYEFIKYMGDGIIRIEQGGEIGYMDSEGKWVVEMK